MSVHYRISDLRKVVRMSVILREGTEVSLGVIIPGRIINVRECLIDVNSPAIGEVNATVHMW